MNNEGVSSIVVVDNQFNVIGNISTVDVKVSQLLFSCSSQADSIAPDAVLVAATSPQHLHAFHLGHSLDAGLDRRQRLIPCLSRQPGLDAGAYSREAGGDPITSVILLSRQFQQPD